jgi:hypothetical protein
MDRNNYIYGLQINLYFLELSGQLDKLNQNGLLGAVLIEVTAEALAKTGLGVAKTVLRANLSLLPWRSFRTVRRVIG